MLNRIKLKNYLQGLPVFLAVREGGSLTQAARSLGVTKAAVSQSLAHLERTLDVRLFQRNTRGLSLTEAGTLLAEQVSGPMGALEEAAYCLQTTMEQVRGELRITASTVAFEFLLLPAIKKLAVQHPSLQVTVDLNDHFVDIVRKGYDVGIRLGEAVEQDMVGRRLREFSPCAVVASPDYLAKRGVPHTLEDLLQHDCIAFSLKDSIVPWEFGKEPTVKHIAVSPKLSLNSLLACVSAAREGLGLTYAIPKSMADKDLASGTLVEVLKDKATPLPPTMLYYSNRKHMSPKIKALLAVMLPD